MKPSRQWPDRVPALLEEFVGLLERAHLGGACRGKVAKDARDLSQVDLLVLESLGDGAEEPGLRADHLGQLLERFLQGAQAAAYLVERVGGPRESLRQFVQDGRAPRPGVGPDGVGGRVSVGRRVDDRDASGRLVRLGRGRYIKVRFIG